MIKKTIKIVWFTICFFIAAGLFAIIPSLDDTELIVEYIIPMIGGLILLGSIFNVAMLIFMYVGNFLGKREYKNERFTKIDKKKYEEYYKYILQTNSPLLLAMVDNYELKLKDFVAELLYLKKNNFIDFENDKIVIKEKDNCKINEIDRYIINCIEENGLLKINYNGIYDKILHEGIITGVIKEHFSKEKIEKKVFFLKIKGILMGVVILLAIIGVIACLMNRKFSETFEVFAQILAIPIMFFYFIYIDKYIKENFNKPFIRTKKGEELNKKLEGLKNYLKDYSLLHERASTEIEIWEDYLIYSVLFGQNEIIIEEYKKYIYIKENLFN